jgi:ribosomal protein S18 acetylase RimI-like enzyme
MRPLEVRRPTPSDIPGLAILLAEMQCHYGEPVSDDAATSAAAFLCNMRREDFAPRPLIAIRSAEVLGSVVLNVTFPAATLSRSLYIRDLYVSHAARRQGVGRALVRAAAELTLAEGFSALDWTTAAGNTPARTMYDDAGANVVNRVYYRLDGRALSQAAA